MEAGRTCWYPTRTEGSRSGVTVAAVARGARSPGDVHWRRGVECGGGKQGSVGAGGCGTGEGVVVGERPWGLRGSRARSKGAQACC